MASKLRRLIELPGVAQLEFKAVMKREFAEPRRARVSSWTNAPPISASPPDGDHPRNPRLGRIETAPGRRSSPSRRRAGTSPTTSAPAAHA